MVEARVSPPSPHDPIRTAGAGSKREAIIDIAAQSFARRGFHGVSMRDIAKANDSSVATLYNHFTGKDALLLAIADRYFENFVPKLEVAAAEPTNGRTRLIDMVRLSVEEGLRYRYEFVSLAQDHRHIRLTEEFKPLVDAYTACMQIWNNVLTEGIQDGSVRSDLNPATTIWLVLCAITGIIEDNNQVGDAIGSVSDSIPTICALFNDGLQPAATRLD
jgi:AcrR family transcriptional regulator